MIYNKNVYEPILKRKYSTFPAKDSTLDLDFINNRQRVAGLYGAALDGVTFTRSTTGTYFGADGTLQTAAINEPRFEYDPVLRRPLGLLIEESRANLIPRSTSIATWVKSPLIIISDNDSTGIDGALSATKITNYDGITSIVAIGFSVPASGTNDYYATVYAKQGNSAGFTLNVYYNSNQEDNVAFNFTTGYVSGAPYPGEYIFESVGNGWFRCGYRITRDASGTRTTILFRIWETIRNNGAIGNYLHVMAPQLEAGAFATSYIPTTAAAVTRGADVASMTGANFSSWWRNDEFSVFAEFVSNNTGTSRVLSFLGAGGDAADDIPIFVFPATGKLASTNLFSSGVNVGRVDCQTGYAAGTNTKAAVQYSLNQRTIFVNGDSGNSSSTSFTAPTITYLIIGSRNFGDYLNGYIRRVIYYPKRLPNNLLQYLSRRTA